ncbi:hypothetical protein D3C75_136010 [compost metagenome]
MNVGQLAASLSLNLQPFMNGIKQATQSLSGLGSRFSNSFGSGPQSQINAMSRSTQKLTSDFKDLDRIVSGIVISQVFYQGLNAIKDTISGVVSFSNEMEKAEIAMKYFLGSAEAANGYILNMKEFAAETAFSTQQALQLSKRILGAQFNAQEVRSVLEILNDANAATGATGEQMDRIVLAMTQMKTNGRIMGGELRQFAEAGIPVYQILREELGLTAEQMANIGHLRIDGDLGVNAILAGLQRRYKGAAKEIAQTLGGMWDSIKDNALFISQRLFEGPYNALKDFVEVWRDTFDEAQKVLMKSGLGGMFEHLVPKELQEPLRVIVGSFQQLGAAIKMVYEATKPMVAILGNGLVTALATILPIISSTVIGFAQYFSWVVQAAPWVQYLGAAILGLMVAQSAAKALMFLWSVTRLGAIAGAVGKAVLFLSAAIKALTIAMARNPLIALIMVAAGALLYLALSSKTASAWLDVIASKLGGLTGIDTSGILKPIDLSANEEAMKAFQKEVSGINDGLKDTGKNIEEAGKKADKTGKKGKKAGKDIKDKFVASFDELYQVPDMLDKVGDALDDTGKDTEPPKLPDMDFKVPDIKLDTAGVKLPDMKGLFDGLGGNLDIPPIFANLKNWFKDFEWPNIPPPNFAVVTHALETINSLLAKLKNAFLELGISISSAFQSLGVTLQNWATNGLTAVGGFVLGGLEKLGEFGLKAGVIITEGLQGVVSGFGNIVTETWTTVSKWAKDINGLFVDLVGDIDSAVLGGMGKAIKPIVDFVGETNKWFSKLTVDAVGEFNKWTSNVLATVTTFGTAARNLFGKLGTDITGIFGNLGTQVQQKWTTMTAGLKTTLDNWITNSKTALTTWTVAVLATLTTFGTNVATNFKKTWDSVTSGLNSFTTSFQKTFTSWASNLNKNLNTLLTNMMTNMGKSMDAMGTNFTKGLVGIGQNVALWVTGVSKGANDLFNSLIKNSGLMAQAVGANFAAWAKSSWNTSKSFFSGMATAVVSWANSFITSIWNGLKAAWEGVKQLAQATGEAIGAFGAGAGEKISNAYQGMSAWVGEHKTEIIVTAGIITAVGVAAALAPVTGGWSLAPLLALETGGIVDQDQLVRIGEGNKREAVIPLENSTYMAPFSAAVANDLAAMLGNTGQANTTTGTMDPRIVVYVQNLIGDERGFKELERKLEVVRLSENARKGG